MSAAKTHVRFTPNSDRTSEHPPTGDHQKPVGPIIKPLSMMLEWLAISHKFVPMQESRVHLCIKNRQAFADGATFGAAGAYEIFYGRARVEIAPIPCRLAVLSTLTSHRARLTA